jgi:hypothetical protein
MAAGFDRQTEALRDKRAEQMGIPRNVLDQQEGRAAQEPTAPNTSVNPFALPGDSFGDDVRRRNELVSTINDPRAGKRERAAALETFKSFMEGAQNAQKVNAASQQKAAIDPIDANRFLLEQQKFGYQQGLDKSRLALDEAKARTEAGAKQLADRKYADERMANFTSSFTYHNPDAPTAALAPEFLKASDATGGAVSPAMLAEAAKKVEAANGIDWKNNKPTSLKAFMDQVVATAAQDYKR